MNKVLNKLHLKINNAGVFYKFLHKYINNFVTYKLNETEQNIEHVRHLYDYQ